MSRGKRYTRKQKKLNQAGKEVPMYCPKCHVQIPSSIFDREDGGVGYVCPMCNTKAFSELKDLLDKINNVDKEEIE